MSRMAAAAAIIKIASELSSSSPPAVEAKELDGYNTQPATAQKKVEEGRREDSYIKKKTSANERSSEQSANEC